MPEFFCTTLYGYYPKWSCHNVKSTKSDKSTAHKGFLRFKNIQLILLFKSHNHKNDRFREQSGLGCATRVIRHELRNLKSITYVTSPLSFNHVLPSDVLDPPAKLRWHPFIGYSLRFAGSLLHSIRLVNNLKGSTHMTSKQLWIPLALSPRLHCRTHLTYQLCFPLLLGYPLPLSRCGRRKSIALWVRLVGFPFPRSAHFIYPSFP